MRDRTFSWVGSNELLCDFMNMLVILVMLFIELGILYYAGKRNNWVCEQRIKFLDDNGLDAYDKLQPYDEMLAGHGFWIWDINYYLET